MLLAPRAGSHTPPPGTVGLDQHNNRLIQTSRGALRPDAEIGPLRMRVEVAAASPHAAAANPALAQRMAAVALSARAMTELRPAEPAAAEPPADPEPLQVIVHPAPRAPDHPVPNRELAPVLTPRKGCCAVTGVIGLVAAGLSAWQAIENEDTPTQRNWIVACAASGLVAVLSLVTAWRASR